MKQLTMDAGASSGKNNQALTGRRFGRLVVLEKTQKRRNRSVLWLCRCDCGNECEKPTNELNSGFAVSCGCQWRQSRVKPGDRFGRLTALEPTEERRGGAVLWKCGCDCGKTLTVRSTMLVSGHTTSCGCVKADIDKERDFKKLLTYRDDTCLEFARNIGKPRKSTSPDTGIRGVTLKNGKYQAQIVFQKKRYYLGRFSRLEDAVKARRQAEARVEEYLERYDAQQGEET